MMDDYIKRENALEIVKRTSGDYAAAWSEISNAEQEDVAPVVHGKWIGKPIAGYCNIRCSECEEIYYNNGKWKYCPNCGARMDG